MSALSANYRRWEGQATGVWTRRYAIASAGLRLCLSSKLLKALLILCWCIGLAMTVVFFLVGQILVPDSPVLAYLTAPFGAKAKAMVDAFASIIMLYPDIVVDGVYRIVFTGASFVLSGITLLMTAFFVSKLMTQDMACQAILIYRSKALTRLDYAIGKLAIALAILGMGWIGPIVGSYALGILVSANVTFLLHSFVAFSQAIGLAFVGVFTISIVALAISSLARKTASAVGFWLMAWILTGVFAGVVSLVYDWGVLLSFTETIESLIWKIFDLPGAVSRIQEMMPLLSRYIDFEVPEGARRHIEGGLSIPYLLIGIGGYIAAAIAIIFKRTDVE